MNLIPMPENVRISEGYFRFPNPAAVNAGGFGEKCLNAFLERSKIRADYGEARKYDLILVRDRAFSEEEYELSVAESGVKITAASEKAVMLALTTLIQLAGGDGLRCCEIRDKPRYKHRGLSFDSARTFFPVEEIKKIIEQMALVKMNVFHWHLTDDQAWRIESKRFPELHRQFGTEFFSWEDVREVVEFAETRGIEVIPEIELPGHVTAFLSVYPEFSCAGKAVKPAVYGGIYPVILCAGNENVYKMVSELLDELYPLFPSEKFHIGGDEAPKKEWKICPLCQKKIKDEGLKDETELQDYFGRRVIEMLRAKGKTAICWNESLEAGRYDTKELIQYWNVNGAEETAEFAEKGGSFIYSDMFTYYFDYPHSMVPLRRLYEEPLNVGDTDFSERGALCGALIGAEACLWTERVSDTEILGRRLFPRLYAAAEIMWGKKSGYADFENRLRGFISLLHPEGMGISPESNWNPVGEARFRETYDYMYLVKNAMPAEMRAAMAVERPPQSERFKRRYYESFFDEADLPRLEEVLRR